ncbi:cytosolic carboxypeptidase-like protein 5 isoform X3 [Diorhabda sublineata]|uniref:cytosolic carboxypeptidase-like protein 5 isoform X3 n=1 Tax=Diorhabda sublineata TaxID=1163346 RepID=UPI0024E0630A|nr:cytosolic carboxypeptidase-like protein 5 isoform X3 [Diorhabda sublineata]
MAGISCAGFTFYNEFDSANLAKVEQVFSQSNEIVVKHLKNPLLQEIIDAEFNIWTKPDCCGTEFENGNRTWFYFGIKAPAPALLVKFNIVDLNRQGKMYSQGMAPVYRIIPGKPRWDRISDKPTHSLNDDIFTLSFKFRTPENLDSIVYFAFTYPFSVTELEKMLTNVDTKYLNMKRISDDDIYYVRETVCHSCDGKPIDLITISSYHGISKEREEKLKNLFNRSNVPRPFKFSGKKVIFVSARVHPGETPSSFVFNGLLSLLLSKDDLVGQYLRKMYVFKLIPFLNPDGVSRGHYRTDSRGVNLNRVYLNPSLKDHPSVYAARALIRFYHFGYEKEDHIPKCENCKAGLPGNQKDGYLSEEEIKDDAIRKKVSRISLNEDRPSQNWCTKWHNFCRNCGAKLEHTQSKEEVQFEKVVVGAHGDINSNESGLFLYIDLHGHASKKGIFMYGNHFDDVERNVECMLLPKLMSINNHNFHFHACNFTERNMYLKDKRDGMSRAGSGRVAVLSLTGIIKSYTLECNYNTGRLVNILPPTIREPHGKMHTVPVPPKYTPQIFEEVGRSLGASILDLTGNNPFTRLANSEFHTLNGLRDWLRNMARELTESRPRKGKLGNNLIQGKVVRPMLKNRSVLPKSLPKKVKTRSAPIPLDRKENLAQSASSKTSMKISKSPFKAKTRKELTLKSKNSAEKLKPVAKVIKKPVSVGTSNQSNLKLESVPQAAGTTQSDKSKDEGVHLREICFINNSEGKAVIAKYENTDKYDDSLVVAWGKNSAHPQLFTRKTRVFSAPPYHLPNKSYSEPSTSKQGGAFRVHNFAKTKARKNLRRLASAADILGKADKKKKKKLKAK